MPRPSCRTLRLGAPRRTCAVKRICDDAPAHKNFTPTRNAGKIAVSVTLHHASRCRMREHRAPIIRLVACAFVRVKAHSPLGKNFAHEAVCGRVVDLTRAKNARIGADRFAFHRRRRRPSAARNGVFRVRRCVARRFATRLRIARGAERVGFRSRSVASTDR